MIQFLTIFIKVSDKGNLKAKNRQWGLWEAVHIFETFNLSMRCVHELNFFQDI